MGIARLVGRLTIGGFFVGHGLQKLRGWFGGPGLEGTEQMMASLRLHPTRQNALAAGVTETAGGALVAAGLFTPLAAAGLIGAMTTAVRTVHLPNGPWNANGGYEYNLTLITALAALVESGPGKLSLDHALGIERRGTGWALGAVALGVAASTATTQLSRRLATQHELEGAGI
ncbi:DoxX family protein [Cumulibacter manganitolerans]|uniref:DoxX family protein n=1 Tax=Cumulibacter manganitolerans TaxID=1884992 RepID=UPI001E47B31D|nr:DoxX family protein [Cumulibacter manganitolerans]